MTKALDSRQFALPVAQILEKSGLNLDECIVVGGSALALHGVRRAVDVDVVIDKDYWDELYQVGATPGGIPLEVNYGRSLFPVRMSGVSEEGDLPLDIITFFSDKKVAKMDDYAERLCENIFGGLALKYLSLKDIQKEKRFTARRKDWHDYFEIRKHLRSQ